MQIGVIGAGFTGLSTAKVLKQFGFDVTVFDKAPDVGGVWSATRRYPGLTTQNSRSTYAMSDFPMPKSYPEWPTGQQVQQYLANYAHHFGLDEHVRLNTNVVDADLDEQAGTWTVTTRDTCAPHAVDTFVCDHLVVANGIFCDPLVPDYPGAREYAAAGGRLCHASEFHDMADARARDIVVVGYGKSSCDVAEALSDVAASTTVVARELIWKMPKKLGNVLNYKYLLLTRMGEGLFRYIRPKGFERFLHGPGRPVRNSVLASVQSVVTRQLRLRELDLLPAGSLERIARSTVSLVTDHFYDKVRDGAISVRRDSTITRLLVHDGRPSAQLSSSEVVPADAVVCGTGFHQRVPFFSAELQDRIVDARGNFELYRQTQPLNVPRLSFNGYNSSLFSPLSAEVGALWIVNLLIGGMTLPPKDVQRAHVAERLRWMEERTEGRHARGTNIVPFSVHNIDELLEDIGFGVSRLTRFKEWLLPVDPGAYAPITTKLLRRQRSLAEPQTGTEAHHDKMGSKTA